MVEGYGSADNRRVVTGLMKVVVRCCEEGTHTPHGGTNSHFATLTALTSMVQTPSAVMTAGAWRAARAGPARARHMSPGNNV